MMTEYKIVLGDYSDDGHGKTDTFVVDIKTPHTQEQLKENFDANVKLFECDPTVIAEEYEDSSIERRILERLIEAGFEYTFTEWNDDDDFINLGTDDMLKIIMFLTTNSFTRKLEWELIDEKMPELVGWNGILTEGFVGYGLFY